MGIICTVYSVLYCTALYCTVCSSIPFSGYNHAYCQRKAVIQAYEAQHGCSLLALFGTTDLVTSRPVCRREVRPGGQVLGVCWVT